MDEYSSSNDSSSENEDDGNEEELCVDNDSNIVDTEGPFRNLNSLLAKAEMNTRIDIPVAVSRAEMMLAIIKFAVVHELSQTGIEDLFKMVNSFFPTNILLDTKHYINKYFNSDDNVQFHAVCSKCDKYIKKFNANDRRVKCKLCKTIINLKDPTYTDYFVIYDVKTEISTLVEENREYFDELKSNINNDDGIIRDFTDGILYKKIISQLTEEEKRNFISAIVNSDGSPLFVSSNFSVWPIQIIINEVPYDQRTKKPIVCGIWFGKGKPNMDVYLKPFVEQMNKLADEGIKCTINGQERCLKVYVICCCVDSQARAPMQGIKQFNGYFGCSWCLHPGLNVSTGRGHSIKYVILDQPVQQRTEANIVSHAIEALEERKPVKGVKKLTVLSALPKFNIVEGFTPDILHCNNLGNAEKFLSLWIDSTRFPYSLDSNEIRKINEYLKQIKLPHMLQRLSRPIDDRKYYKGKEYENWTIFLSVPILSSFPRFQPYIQHWSLYVKGYYILMQDRIMPAELHRAHELLTEFVIDTETLYSKSSMTYNVHQILHLTPSTVNWGPQPTHSGYCFESGNGQIVKMVHAAKGVTRQISRAITMRQSVISLKGHIETTNPTSPVLNYVSYLDKRHAKNTLKLSDARYFGKHYATEVKWIEELSLSQSARTYKKMVKQRCLYTSCENNRLRSDNSYAITVEGTYVKISKFIVDPIESKEYTLCYQLEVQQSDDPSKRIISVSDVLISINTSSINKICVHLVADVLDAEYVCAVPNLYYV